MQLPHDHHCPWRDLAESMERRFGEIIARQQAVIEQQQAMIRDLENQLELARADKARMQTLETEVAALPV